MNFFKDLEDQQVFNRASELQSECLWFVFASLLQADLDYVKEHWNTHYIRKSRYDTVAGRPDSLYFLPEVNGGVSDIILPVPALNTTWFTHKHMLWTMQNTMCSRSIFIT